MPLPGGEARSRSDINREPRACPQDHLRPSPSDSDLLHGVRRCLNPSWWCGQDGLSGLLGERLFHGGSLCDLLDRRYSAVR